MSGDKTTVYVDSCVLIAWLQNENRKPGEMEGVSGLVAGVDAGEIILVTSALTKTEILECTLTVEAIEMFERFTHRRSVQIKDVTSRISTLAGEIRSYYQSLKDSNKTNLPTLSTPDAIHIATAIYWECEQFFTFDEIDEHGTSRPKRALIPLSGMVAEKYPLDICKPTVRQPGLAL
ncbi:MAG: PIN domain-containing protein [Proteobacteria bacterium]|nr:PIN domain-containing protein [Pseudomonadota bacterium]